MSTSVRDEKANSCFTVSLLTLFHIWNCAAVLILEIKTLLEAAYFYEMCVSAKACTFLCERRPKPANKGLWCRCCGPGANALSDRGDAILGAPRSSPTILFAPRVCKHLGVGEEGGSDCLNLLLFPQKRIKPTTVSLSLSLQTPIGYKDVYFPLTSLSTFPNPDIW